MYNPRRVRSPNVFVIRRRKGRWSIVPNKLFLRRVRGSPGAKLSTNDGVNLNIPCANYIFDAKKSILSNLFWAFVILCSIVICGYQTCDRIQFFLSNPVATQISIKRNASVKFPSLTICRPENSKLATFPLLHQKSNSDEDCERSPFDLLPELNLSSIWYMMNIEGLVLSSEITALRETFMNATPKLYVTSTLTIFGNCTTYAIKTLVPFKGEGYAGSIMFQNQPEYPCGKDEISACLFHHDDEDITYARKLDFTYLQNDEVLEYALTAKQFLLVNRINAPCDSVAVVSQCKKKCFEDFIKTDAACRLPISEFTDIPLCVDESSVAAEFKRVIHLIQKFTCEDACKCPVICDEIVYHYGKKLSGNYSNARLEYYYEDNIILYVEEYYSYNLVPFLCEIGGNLGLCLGLCIPAVVELLQSIVIHLYTKVRNVF